MESAQPPGLSRQLIPDTGAQATLGGWGVEPSGGEGLFRVTRGGCGHQSREGREGWGTGLGTRLEFAPFSREPGDP